MTTAPELDHSYSFQVEDLPEMESLALHVVAAVHGEKPQALLDFWMRSRREVVLSGVTPENRLDLARLAVHAMYNATKDARSPGELFATFFTPGGPPLPRIAAQALLSPALRGKVGDLAARLGKSPREVIRAAIDRYVGMHWLPDDPGAGASPPVLTEPQTNVLLWMLAAPSGRLDVALTAAVVQYAEQHPTEAQVVDLSTVARRSDRPGPRAGKAPARRDARRDARRGTSPGPRPGGTAS